MEKCDLTSAEISRYSRQLILPQFGVSGQLKLRSARVLIVGCGGLGCPAAVYLTAAGVGTIGLVDDDKVELNNLHRQIAHSESTINMSKVHSLADRCMRLNSTVNIQIHEIHLDNTNALDIIKKYDVIMDCSDNLATRYLVNEACAVTGPKPLVSGSALRLEGQMTVYLTKRILSTGEMLSPNKLPPESRAPCFRCIYPVPPPKGSVHGCSEAGVFGVVPGIIGTMQAAEVIKLLTGIGDVHTGKLFLLDVERNLTRSVKLRGPRPNCPVCESSELNIDKPLTNYVLFCGAPSCDKPRTMNMVMNAHRITVQQLKNYIDSELSHLLIDVRPKVEFDICHLKSSINVPLSELFRDSVISEIRQIMDTKISKGAVLPFPVILLCYRGNKSAEVAPLLKCALSSLRCSNSDNNFDLDVTHSLQVESKCFNAEPDSSEFIICDVAGGLLAWSLEVDPNFPIY
ncbi:Adenylyltransferase and sulfurtransferase MOCS3 [Schistosoma japonicum]|nr:Adenylyltransferase and sulfurtransferase MOCS3 [Schistosoma japonicum]